MEAGEGDKNVTAPAGNQTRVSSVAGTYTITVLPALSVFAPRLELGISRVLGERHDQLDHANSLLEYLGFDPSTSSLLRTHASDCANTPDDTCGIRTHAFRAHSLSRRAP